MKYRALRGVCVGPGKTLLPTDLPIELDAATAQFLVSIKAVEEAKDEPVADEPKIESAPAPKGSGKKEK